MSKSQIIELFMERYELIDIQKLDRADYYYL